MFEFFWQILTYIGLVVVGFFLWATLTPFEVMGWWAGWFGDRIYSDDFPPDGLCAQCVRGPTAISSSYRVLGSVGGIQSTSVNSYGDWPPPCTP